MNVKTVVMPQETLKEKIGLIAGLKRQNIF
jgi:hypothetical protein